MKNALTFDDIKIGQTFDSDTYLMSLDEIIEFASHYDPQPMHLDENASATGPFGQLIASGWHTLSLTMKLMAEAKPFGETPLIGVGVEGMEFKRPVYPETTIAVRAEVIKARQSIKSGRGFVTMRVETRNVTDDEVMIRQVWTVLVPT